MFALCNVLATPVVSGRLVVVLLAVYVRVPRSLLAISSVASVPLSDFLLAISAGFPRHVADAFALVYALLVAATLAFAALRISVAFDPGLLAHFVVGVPWVRATACRSSTCFHPSSACDPSSLMSALFVSSLGS